MRSRDQPHQVLLDLFRIGLAGQPKTMGQPAHVSIDDDALIFPEGVAQDDVRRFSPDSGKPVQLLHGIGNLSSMFRHDRRRRAANAFGFASKKSGRTDQLFERGRGRLRIILRSPKFREEGWRDKVDALVGTLRRQNGRDQQLKRRTESELAMRVRVDRGKRFY